MLSNLKVYCTESHQRRNTTLWLCRCKEHWFKRMGNQSWLPWKDKSTRDGIIRLLLVAGSQYMLTVDPQLCLSTGVNIGKIFSIIGRHQFIISVGIWTPDWNVLKIPWLMICYHLITIHGKTWNKSIALTIQNLKAPECVGPLITSIQKVG